MAGDTDEAQATMTRSRTWVVALVVTVLIAVCAAWVWHAGGGDEPDRLAARPRPSQALPSSSPSAAPTCDKVDRAFSPRTVSVPGVARPVKVITPPRDAAGVPGVAPLTKAGKAVFAWDRQQGISPGDPAGNVLLNAHTWPDGSALGNRLLAGLHRGDRILVRGGPAERLCYRVTERVEVPGDRDMPRYYVTDGPPQLAIVVCSGRRLGPGIWTKRTVWFASPAV
jgi:hypothetical protein